MRTPKHLKTLDMDTSKAIKLIKNHVVHYMVMENLWSIGLSTDYFLLCHTDLCEIIFDIDRKRPDIDDVLNIFNTHADKLRESITNWDTILPDDDITSTAIDIYSDWKAFSQRQPIEA